MRVVVTGGAGYIGSHAVVALLDAGHEVAVVDDLSAGHAAAVDPRATLRIHDVRDRDALYASVSEAEAVLHFAALSDVAESVRDPERYLRHNLESTRAVLDVVRRAGVGRLVFSSSAAVYGAGATRPICEDDLCAPINPYGESKLACEALIAGACSDEPGLSAVALRYFNVAGASACGALGEDHRPETHLVPLLLRAAQSTTRRAEVFGDDYPTPDGSCVRDYLHVSDLVAAHQRALSAMRPGFEVYNVGSGRGWSVFEVMASVKRVTGVELEVTIGPRRPGDPPYLVTDSRRIGQDLGWEPAVRHLDPIVASAWRWLRDHPSGFDDPGAGFAREEVEA